MHCRATGSKAYRASTDVSHANAVAEAETAANAHQQQLLDGIEAEAHRARAAEEGKAARRVAERGAKEAAEKASEDARRARQRAEEAQARHSAVCLYLGFGPEPCNYWHKSQAGVGAHRRSWRAMPPSQIVA